MQQSQSPKWKRPLTWKIISVLIVGLFIMLLATSCQPSPDQNTQFTGTPIFSVPPTKTPTHQPTPTLRPAQRPTPSPTPKPQPTQSKPTQVAQKPTPTPTPVPHLTITFTCAQAVDYSSGNVCVRVLPGAALTIQVKYCSGYYATSSSLQGTVYADGAGNYTWSWTPNTKCKGTATAYVTANGNGQSASNADSFTVQ